MTFSRSEVIAYYSARVPALKINNSKEFRGPCPIHSGKDPNFAVNAETGLAQCHSQCGRGWDILALEQEISGLDFVRAKERVYELLGKGRVPWADRDVEAVYDYTDAQGGLLYQVVRMVGKKFRQRRPDGEGGWIWNLGDIEPVPFHLPRVIQADFVGIAEGEKDALSLDRVEITGTCNNGGAEHFRPELAKWFKGKKIGIFPDNDDKGQKHAIMVAALLAPIAASVKIVEMPGLKEKQDISDFIGAGNGKAEIRELYRKAVQWTPEWEFATVVPDENEKYVRTISQEIAEAGGLTEFWDLAKLSGLETPWPKLSRALGGGMRRGEVYVIGANQGAGKTSLALQFAEAAMVRREGVCMFSMEMGWRSVFQRMAGIRVRMNVNAVQNAQYTMKRRDATPEERMEAKATLESTLPELCRATAELADLPLIVSRKSAVTPEYIVSETARLRKSMRIHLVIVDHMQLMGTEKTPKSEYEKFTLISRSMKQVAVDLDVPVLLVSQTSRAQSKDRRTELEVSDLRGSGAIEEDAAGVLLLYEDSEDRAAALAEIEGSRYTTGPVKCWLKVGKNRFGEQGRCFALSHTKTCTRFDPWEDR